MISPSLLSVVLFLYLYLYLHSAGVCFLLLSEGFFFSFHIPDLSVCLIVTRNHKLFMHLLIITEYYGKGEKEGIKNEVLKK